MELTWRQDSFSNKVLSNKTQHILQTLPTVRTPVIHQNEKHTVIVLLIIKNKIAMAET